MSQHQQHHRAQHERQRSSSSSAVAIKSEEEVGMASHQYENPFVYDQNVWPGGMALPRTMPPLNTSYHQPSLDSTGFIGQASSAPMASTHFSVSVNTPWSIPTLQLSSLTCSSVRIPTSHGNRQPFQDPLASTIPPPPIRSSRMPPIQIRTKMMKTNRKESGRIVT